MTHLRALLAGAIDYAGLFPPASLRMEEAVRNYAAYGRSGYAWMLGRLVVPVSRLSECVAAVDALPEALRAGLPWNLSALAGTDLPADLRAVAAFNEAHRTGPGPALHIDSVEFKANRRTDIEPVSPMTPGRPALYAEIPIESDPAPLLEWIAGAKLRGKVRTGGVTPDAFPSSIHLARFIVSCVQARIPFKATAGLHHPVRGRYRLTYAEESPTGSMFGFLNVLFATAVAGAGAPVEDVRRMLEEEDPGALKLDAERVVWGSIPLQSGALAATRTHVAAFGSCSFDEPVHDLQQMGLL